MTGGKTTTRQIQVTREDVSHDKLLHSEESTNSADVQILVKSNHKNERSPNRQWEQANYNRHVQTNSMISSSKDTEDNPNQHSNQLL